MDRKVIKKLFFMDQPPIYLSLRNYNHMTTEVRHCHEFHELVYVMDGKGQHILGKDRYQIHAGDVFLIKPDVSHHYESMEKLSIANFLFLPEKMTEYIAPLKNLLGYYVLFDITTRRSPETRLKNHCTLSAEKTEQINRIIKTILDEQETKQSGYEYLTLLYFFQILTMICRAFSSAKISSNKDNIRLSSVLRFIEQHYDEPIQLTELARVFDRSVQQFIRSFKQITDETPIQYLNNLRLEKSAELLKHTSLNITSIASNVGFNDSNYFTTIFTRKYKISPRAFRKP